MSAVIDIQDPIVATNRQQPTVLDDKSLYCEVCETSYSSKNYMSKHLKSSKHTANFTKEAAKMRDLDPIEID